VENATPGVTPASDADKSPNQIEREMADTRESITEKVAALESQVLGTIQTATSTVTDTVEAVKSLVTGAPSAVSDTVTQTVAAVKDSVRETIGSFSVSGCVRDNPMASVGASALVGFLTGLLLPGGRSRPLMARGYDTPAPAGRPGVGYSVAAVPATPREPGVFDEVFGMLRKELREMARMALDQATAAVKQNIHTAVPQLVDSAVQRATEVARPGDPAYTARG